MAQADEGLLSVFELDTHSKHWANYISQRNICPEIYSNQL